MSKLTTKDPYTEWHRKRFNAPPEFANTALLEVAKNNSVEPKIKSRQRVSEFQWVMAGLVAVGIVLCFFR